VPKYFLYQFGFLPVNLIAKSTSCAGVLLVMPEFKRERPVVNRALHWYTAAISYTYNTIEGTTVSIDSLKDCFFLSDLLNSLCLSFKLPEMVRLHSWAFEFVSIL